jgi:hypothetical protein
LTPGTNRPPGNFLDGTQCNGDANNLSSAIAETLAFGVNLLRQNFEDNKQKWTPEFRLASVKQEPDCGAPI